MNSELEYWKKRCELAENRLKELDSMPIVTGSWSSIETCKCGIPIGNGLRSCGRTDCNASTQLSTSIEKPKSINTK